MALSADEQRTLAEIERRLAADDPGLATCMTAFRRPGPASILRSPRARIIGSLFTVLLVAMVSLMVYAMIPFRTHHGPPASASTSASAAATAAKSQAKSATPSSGRSAVASQPQATGSQAGQVASPSTGP